MSRSVLILVRFFLLALLFTIFAGQTAFAADKKYRAVSDSGNVYELTIAAETIETMKPLPIMLSVKNAGGVPVSGVKVSCSLTMPAMAMPNNSPPIKESDEAGLYKGFFLLTMGGLWHVEFSFAGGSGEQNSVIIPIAGEVPGQSNDKSVDAQLEALFQDKGKTE